MADVVKLDNRVVAGAVRAARFAARMNRPVTSCPYKGDEVDVSALRRVWLSAYLRKRPPAKGSVSYKGDGGRVAAAAEDDDEAKRVQRSYEAALAGLLAAWPILAAPLVDDLTVGADRSDTAGLGSLAASAATVDGIASALSTAMATLAVDAANQVTASAAAQGVDVPPVQPDAGRLAEIATVTAALIASGYATAAARRAMLAPAGMVADVVRTALTDMTVAQKGMVADHLSAALSTAQGQGRLAVLAAAPAQAYVGSESQEAANRCAACTAADGRRYPTLAEALRDRPNGMQLAACAGMARCRGALLPIWP